MTPYSDGCCYDGSSCFVNGACTKQPAVAALILVKQLNADSFESPCVLVHDKKGRDHTLSSCGDSCKTSCSERAKKESCSEDKCSSSPCGQQSMRMWLRRVLYMSVATILVNVIEGALSVAFGGETMDISLISFGADSFIEVFAGGLVFWRFYHQNQNNIDNHVNISRREKIATRLIGLSLCVLGVATATASVAGLVLQSQPNSTLPGMIIGCVSFSVMFILLLMKARIAVQLDSTTVEKEAECNISCLQLSASVLVGSLVYYLAPSLWWFDSATALLICLLIFHEGYSTIQATYLTIFSGGCGCSQSSRTMKLIKRIVS